ncbi:unnamed protein product [Parnassius apollo]|uniref:(apollo) hypothetical protein n=1 Tax=Parnassius apollo TaxID=110799 RepID=A0A8S3XNQ6_PARAO|nr:unnamed protein product [Parnassius apollo]
MRNITMELLRYQDNTKLKKMKVSVAAQTLSATTSGMLKYTASFKTTTSGENVSETMATTASKQSASHQGTGFLIANTLGLEIIGIQSFVISKSVVQKFL